MPRHFDEYLFADYSGGGLHDTPQKNLALWHADGSAAARRVEPARGRRFSRSSLAGEVGRYLDRATDARRRLVFGFDHQYAWPSGLRVAAGIDGLPWRAALRALRDGANGWPPLTEPVTYCAAFNAAAGQQHFWTPLAGRAVRYGIGRDRPLAPAHTRYRLTERARPARPDLTANPKPADAVGGMGEGIVGGQTICGLRWLADLAERQDVAWWPFDGLNLISDAYAGKHVGVEIYPSALRPPHVPQTDDNDAEHSVRYVFEADANGTLSRLLNLSGLSSAQAKEVLVEGWIVGMLPLA